MSREAVGPDWPTRWGGGDAAGRGLARRGGDRRRAAGRGRDRGQFASRSWNPRQPSWTDELASDRRRAGEDRRRGAGSWNVAWNLGQRIVERRGREQRPERWAGSAMDGPARPRAGARG